MNDFEATSYILCSILYGADIFKSWWNAEAFATACLLACDTAQFVFGWALITVWALNPFILLTGVFMICYPEKMSHLSKRGKSEESFDSKEIDYDSQEEEDETTDDDVFISDLDHRRHQAR